MKILIVPFIKNPKCDANYHMTSNILSVLSQANHTCAISCDADNHFHGANIYPSPKIRTSLFFDHGDFQSYEEEMYYRGGLSKKYLSEDYEHLRRTIQSFQPDLIIALDRFMAIIIAKKYNIPIWTIVHSGMFHNKYIQSKFIKDLNSQLSHHKLPQVHYLHELFQYCSRRIGFGPIEVAPFLDEHNIDRIGISSLTPIKTPRKNRISIFLNNTNLSTSSLKKTLRSSFEGAPYQTYIWLPNCSNQTYENVTFMSSMKLDVLDGSMACIHDGNPYIFNACLARGILQLIITDHSYSRLYNAQSLKRNNLGLFLYEDELNMAKLYETYRLLVTDDKYYYFSHALQEVTTQDGDLTKILDYLDNNTL